MGVRNSFAYEFNAGNREFIPTTTTAMSLSLEEELPEDIYNGLIQMGYTFGQQLGSGAFGSAYDCNWTNLENKREVLAVKHINFENEYKYSPQFRPQTDKEREEYRKRLLKKEKNIFRRILIRFGSTNKVVEKTPDLAERAKGEQLRTEIQAMHRTNHPNVVKMMNILEYYDQNKNPNPTHLLIFMEKADSDLATFQRKNIVFNESDAQDYSTQIIRGLAHIHSKGIAHLDLKPENILVFKVPGFVQRILLKITDFGISILFPVGAPAGVITFQRDSEGQVSDTQTYDAFKSDVWNFGVLVLHLVAGECMAERNLLEIGLFQELGYAPKSSRQASKEISNALIRFTGIHSADLLDLLTKVFVDDLSQRLSTLEVCEHKWIRNVLAQQRQSQPSFQS